MGSSPPPSSSVASILECLPSWSSISASATSSAPALQAFVDDDIIGSAEFATKLSGAKLIVVLGHSECGAVKGAIDGAQLGLLTQLLQRIKPAIDANNNAPGEHTSKNKAFVQQVAVTNTKLAAQNFLKKSEVLRDLVARNELKIVSAMHEVASGRITFIE